MGPNRRYGDPLHALQRDDLTPRGGPVRHVVVNLSNLERASSHYPGVIIEWRRTSAGWEAQVAYVVDHEGHATLHVVWCPAARLRPVRDAE